MKGLRVPLAITFAGVLVAWALYTSLGGTFTLPWAGRAAHPGAVRPVAASDHIFGNPAAPVKIVEYCDFTSDYCKGFFATMHELIATAGAGGQVAWVYRHFPLHPEQGNAQVLARAAECAAKAGGQSGFWSFADQLYAAQPVDPATFGALSSKAGLPSKAFAQCYADAASQVDAAIAADRANALAVGADGAPYSILIVKGKSPTVIDGAYPYDQLRQVVEAAIPASTN